MRAIWDHNGTFIEPRPASICSTGIEAGIAAIASASAAAAPYLGAASIGMDILGGLNQSAAQRAAGEAAYQTALQRAQMANVVAVQQEQQASNEQGAAQRRAIEARRKGMLTAGRLRAVMGASGGGIDDNLIASLQGEGDYNSGVALYEGNERARVLRNDAALKRWSGNAAVGQGAFERSAYNSAADATLVGSIGRGAMSFARMYGGEMPKSPLSGIDSEIAEWSRYGARLA